MDGLHLSHSISMSAVGFSRGSELTDCHALFYCIVCLIISKEKYFETSVSLWVVYTVRQPVPFLSVGCSTGILPVPVLR